MVINNQINALAEQPLMFLSQYKLKTFIVDAMVIIILIFGLYEYYTVGLYFIENTVIATQEWYSTQKQRIGSLVFI